MEVLKNISKIIDEESLITIKNYLIWRFLIKYIDYMPKRFRILKEKFNKIFAGVEKEKPRKIKCAQQVNKYMGFAISKLYINKYFDQYSKEKVCK